MVFVGVFLSHPVYGDTHYVDLNSMNPVSPFLSWDKAATKIRKAVDVAANGVYDASGEVTSSASHDLVRQLADSLDTGDSYMTLRGRRSLHRLAGAVAVDIEDSADKATTLRATTVDQGPLPKYTVKDELDGNMVWLEAPTTTRTLQLQQPQALQQTIRSVAQTHGIRYSRPVFIEPESGLWLIPTDEIVVRLKPDVDPEAYFGGEFARVRQLPGTRDRFALSLPGTTTEEVLAEVNKRFIDERVKWAEPLFIGQIVEHLTPNDTYYPNQWHLNNTGQGGGATDADVDAPLAWNRTTGSNSVIIAVVDDGVQINHPDLIGSFPSNSDEPIDGVDNDGNGYQDDRNGWDMYSDDSDPSPETGDDHGTCCAGVASADGNNSLGIAGAAYGCKLMPLRTKLISAVPNAVYYAGGRTRDGAGTWHGADVISMSIGFPWTQDSDDALTWAAANGRNGKGCPIFVSTGNSAGAYVTYNFGTTSLPSGTYRVHVEYYKDPSGTAGDDRVWVSSVVMPDSGQTWVKLNSSTFPSGWSGGGDAGFSMALDPAHVNGLGRYVARSGSIGNSQYSSLISAAFTLVPGNTLSLKCWISSEKGTDTSINYPPDGDDGDWVFLWFERVGVEWYSGLVDAGVPGDRRNFSGDPVNAAIGYPSSHSDTIAVGASTDHDYRSGYSQYGTGLDLMAPSGGGASGVYTTDRTGADGYETSDYNPGFSGTSSSCPLAAGIGALVLSKNPTLTSMEVRTILRQSCDKIGGETYSGGQAGCGGWNQYYGYGRVNAYVAVTNTPEPNAMPPSGFQAVATGTSQINLSWTQNASNDNVLVAYNTNDVFGTPSNGTSYSVGNMIGPATVLYNGSLTNYSHTNLNTDTMYYYQAWSVDGSTEYSAGASTAAATPTPPATLPFYEAFPTLSFASSNWALVDDAAIDTVGIGEPSAPYSARFNGNPDGGDELRSVVFNLAGETQVELSYFYQRKGGGNSTESGDDLIVEYKNASEAWVELERQLGSGSSMSTFAERVIDLPEQAMHASFQFRFTNSATAGAYDDWFVDDIRLYAPSLEISTATLPTGMVAFPYLVTLEATNGISPYTWSIDSGSLQAGLALSSGGVISGTPTESGTNQIVFAVEDDDGSSTNKMLDLIVLPQTVDHFTWDAIGSTQYVGQAISVSITAKDASNNTISSFTNNVTLSGWTGSSGSANDDFDRPDSSSLGANWTVQSGTWRIETNRGRSSPNSTKEVALFNVATSNPVVSADVVYLDSGRITYCALISRFASLADNVFIKVQDNNSAGNFNRVYFYYGDGGAWSGMTGGSSSESVSAFTQARITTRVVGGSVTLEIDRNFDGVPEDVMTRGGLPLANLGNGVALGGYNNAVFDNFSIGDGGGGQVSITPTNSGNFVAGMWTGTVTVQEVVTNMVLRADDGSGRTGDSNPFNVFAQAGDIDGDGIPDWWEDQYYGGPTNANPDAVCSNAVNTVLEAYVAGFDPTDPLAAFVMTQLDGEPPSLNNLILQWTAVSGRVYTIYWSSNLLNGFAGSPIASNITGGVFTDTVHGANDDGFYKIGVRLFED